jgi:hypothetical protein
MGYGLDGKASTPGRDKKFLRPGLLLTQPPVQWVPAENRLGREADHSPPSTAEVKDGAAISPLPDMSSWRGAQLT